MQRLTSAHRDATVVEFDDTSTFVWLSDSHRGDGSMSDEFMKNKNIFLTAGRLYRMFGNHDFDMADPRYVREHFERAPNPHTGRIEPFLAGLVVHEAILLRHRQSGRELLTVHGHQGDFSNDQFWRFTRFTFRLFWRRMHMLGIKSPSSPVQNSFKRHKVERNFNKWIMRTGIPLICGHTHRERFPRGDDLPYFTTGSCVFPSYITALELVEGALALVGWRAEPDAHGYLHIRKSILIGPRHVDSLFVDPEADITPPDDGPTAPPEARTGPGVPADE